MFCLRLSRREYKNVTNVVFWSITFDSDMESQVLFFFPEKTGTKVDSFPFPDVFFGVICICWFLARKETGH
jgi:hypothetical protein